MRISTPRLNEEIRARLHLRRPCWETLRAAYPELSDSTFWRRVRSERDQAAAERSRSRRDLRNPFASVERRRDMTRLLTDLNIRGQLVACFDLADRIRDTAIGDGKVNKPFWADQSVGLRFGLITISAKALRIIEGIELEIAWERRFLKSVRAASPGFAAALNAGKISLFHEEQVWAFRQRVSIFGDACLYDVSPGATPATLRRALAARRNLLKPLLRLADQMFDDTYAKRFANMLCDKISALPEPDRLNLSLACIDDLEALQLELEEAEAEREIIRKEARRARAA